MQSGAILICGYLDSTQKKFCGRKFFGSFGDKLAV
jgi:hypothetical protein